MSLKTTEYKRQLESLFLIFYNPGLNIRDQLCDLKFQNATLKTF